MKNYVLILLSVLPLTSTPAADFTCKPEVAGMKVTEKGLVIRTTREKGAPEIHVLKPQIGDVFTQVECFVSEESLLAAYKSSNGEESSFGVKAVNLKTGKLEWRKSIPPRTIHPQNPVLDISALVFEEKSLCVSTNAGSFRYAIKDGTVLGEDLKDCSGK